MGGTGSKLTYSPKGFTVYMMVGLQGTGKTTTCGKLANYLKKNGKKPMLCACDIYGPAALDQLEVVGKAVDTPVFTMRESREPEKIALAAIKEAERKGCNVLIVHTVRAACRLDEELMEELARHEGERCPASRDPAGSRCADRAGRSQRGRGLQRQSWGSTASS